LLVELKRGFLKNFLRDERSDDGDRQDEGCIYVRGISPLLVRVIARVVVLRRGLDADLHDDARKADVELRRGLDDGNG
jgi:hypothetical protein